MQAWTNVSAGSISVIQAPMSCLSTRIAMHEQRWSVAPEAPAPPGPPGYSRARAGHQCSCPTCQPFREGQRPALIGVSEPARQTVCMLVHPKSTPHSCDSRPHGQLCAQVDRSGQSEASRCRHRASLVHRAAVKPRAPAPRAPRLLPAPALQAQDGTPVHATADRPLPP